MRKTIIILFFALISNNQLYSQRSSSMQNNNSELIGYKIKNYVQLTLQSGFLNPVNPYLLDSSYPSANFGFDLTYRINKEVALYTEVKYNFLNSKDVKSPSKGYFESTVGARYYIRPHCCRSSFFFEAGFGPYVYFQGASTLQEPQEIIDPNGSKMDPPRYTDALINGKQSKLYVGANAGIGTELVLSNSLFLTLKSKINSVFEKGGGTTYITGVGGFTIRF